MTTRGTKTIFLTNEKNECRHNSHPNSCFLTDNNNSQTNKTMGIRCKGEDLHRESEKRTLNDFNKIKLGYPPPHPTHGGELI